MKFGSFVTISRKWDNPYIRITIDNTEINIQIDLDDFISSVKKEMGRIAFVVKQDTLNSMLDAAIERVIKGIKEESAKVV